VLICDFSLFDSLLSLSNNSKVFLKFLVAKSFSSL